MEQLKIYTIEDPKEEKLLRTRSKEVSQKELNSKEFQKFIKDLLYTAQTSEGQVGLESAGISAPQVGVLKRVSYALDYNTGKFELLINPVVQNIGEKTDIDLEGCLSVPNREGKVERFRKIKVKYINENGDTVKRRFTDLNARVVQHEVDHLNGVLFIDKLVD
jgi:peptide deformylase